MSESTEYAIINAMPKSDSDDPRSQSQKFQDLARELGDDQREEAFDESPKQLATAPRTAKTCRECGHTFRGNGWDGIDAHWRAKHEHTLPYEEAWPMLKNGAYKRSG